MADTSTSGVMFTAAGAAKIKKVVGIVLRTDRTGGRTGSTPTETGFWGLITGVSLDGNRYTFLRVYPSADNDSGADFILTNGPRYRIIGEEPEEGLAREVNGTKSVPIFSVVWCVWSGYDADGLPAFFFQWVGPTEDRSLPIHDHTSNDSGGLAFAIYAPGTSLPQQPWAI